MLMPGTIHAGVESPFAWLRLATAVLLGTVGSIGAWAVPVVLPAVQADFGVARADASLPYTLAMVGFAVGGVLMGRLSDRFGVLAPAACSAISLCVGLVAAGFAPNLITFALVYVLIGIGASGTFGPLMADISQWFTYRRGIAVAIVASGNYVGGADLAAGPAALRCDLRLAGNPYRGRLGVRAYQLAAPAGASAARPGRTMWRRWKRSRQVGILGLSPNVLQAVLCVAGFSCCVAMAMPQVHIVAYCGDLGYGVARGAEMLSLMLGFGIISRVASGVVADRIGGVMTLLLSSALQGLALFFYFLFDGLASLYVISALFGLFQGGIVPMYALIVRQYFPPREVGMRLGIVLMATLFGMALGGWMSGVIFDLTGSYRAAFVNGLLWNLVNASIAVWLLIRPRGGLARA